MRGHVRRLLLHPIQYKKNMTAISNLIRRNTNMYSLIVWCVYTAVRGSAFFLFDREERSWQSVDPNEGVRCQVDVLARYPSIFHHMTNFTVEEFEELSLKVCPFISHNARSTGRPHTKDGRPTKLSPMQRLLNCILYLKHVIHHNSRLC